MNIDSIFDDVIEEITVKPPIAILKELALALEKRTQGLLVGDVKQEVWSTVSLDFYITAPSLNNYSYEVFSITHDLNFYPLEVRTSVGIPTKKAKTQEDLEVILKEIFSSSEVKKVINGLLGQIKAV